MTLNEMVFDIVNAVRLEDDDLFITESYVEELINQYRAKYLRREYAKRPFIPVIYRQSFVVNMELVNSSVSSGTETNRYILRSKEYLPQFLTLGKEPGIYSITSIDRNVGEFNLIDKARAKYALDAPMCNVTAYIDTDNRIYIESTLQSFTQLKKLVFDAAIEDPRDVLRFEYIDEQHEVATGITEITDYPIDKAIWNYVKGDIVNEVLRLKLTPPDLENQQPVAVVNPVSGSGNNEYSTDHN